METSSFFRKLGVTGKFFFFLVNIIRANEDYKIIKIQISNISIQVK